MKHTTQEAGYLRRLGQIVRNRREDAKIKQADMAKRVGVHPTYLSHVETGMRNLSLTLLRRIAKELDTDLGTLDEQAAS